jgi:hypothetical protein
LDENIMAIEVKYARCEVSAGMFDSEAYVILGSVSALVDKRNVKTESPLNGVAVAGAVRVYLIDERRDEALIELPGEAVVGGLRTWVPKASLTAA